MKNKSFYLGVTFLAVFLLSVPVFAQNTNTANDYGNAKKEWQNKMKELKQGEKQISAEAKAQNLEKAKLMVEKTIEKVIAKLEKIKKTINGSSTITNKDQYLTKIDGFIADLNALDTRAKNATNKNDLKVVATDSRAKIKEIKTYLQSIKDQVKKNEIDTIISNWNKIIDKLAVEIATLKNQGKDTTVMEKELNDVKTLLGQAKDKNKSGDTKGAHQILTQARIKLAHLIGQVRGNK